MKWETHHSKNESTLTLVFFLQLFNLFFQFCFWGTWKERDPKYDYMIPCTLEKPHIPTCTEGNVPEDFTKVYCTILERFGKYTESTKSTHRYHQSWHVYVLGRNKSGLQDLCIATSSEGSQWLLLLLSGTSLNMEDSLERRTCFMKFFLKRPPSMLSELLMRGRELDVYWDCNRWCTSFLIGGFITLLMAYLSRKKVNKYLLKHWLIVLINRGYFGNMKFNQILVKIYLRKEMRYRLKRYMCWYDILHLSKHEQILWLRSDLFCWYGTFYWTAENMNLHYLYVPLSGDVYHQYIWRDCCSTSTLKFVIFSNTECCVNGLNL